MKLGIILRGVGTAWTLGVALAGCAAAGPSGPVAFPADPLTVMTSASGQLQIAVRTSPNPLVKGVNTVQYVVTDAVTGAGLDGLDVTATPWMPSHGHGTGAKTLVDPEGGGVYQVDNVYFYMDGTWELRTALDSSAGTDSVIPSFDVP